MSRHLAILLPSLICAGCGSEPEATPKPPPRPPSKPSTPAAAPGVAKRAEPKYIVIDDGPPEPAVPPPEPSVESLFGLGRLLEATTSLGRQRVGVGTQFRFVLATTEPGPDAAQMAAFVLDSAGNPLDAPILLDRGEERDPVSGLVPWTGGRFVLDVDPRQLFRCSIKVKEHPTAEYRELLTDIPMVLVQRRR